jgi:hypothetical protein
MRPIARIYPALGACILFGALVCAAFVILVVVFDVAVNAVLLRPLPVNESSQLIEV